MSSNISSFHAEQANPKRWGILAVLVTALVVVILDNTVLNVALKTIQLDLDASQSELVWAINSYTLVFAALLFTWGVMGDRYGRKKILMIGLVLFGLASALSAWSSSPEMLIITRALMGIGGASVTPVTLAIITVVFPPHERGKAIGFWAGAVGGSVALGPIVAGLLLEQFWWGSVFLINVPIVIAGLIGIWILVPESKNPTPGKLDPLGVLLSVTGLLLLVYGIIHAGDVGWSSPTVWLTAVAGIAILFLFGFLERRSDHPSLDLALFRIKSFSVPLFATTLTFAAMSGSLLFLVFYQQIVRGLTPLQAGVQTLPVAIGQILAAPNSSRLVNKFGNRKVIITGLSIAATAFILFTFLTPETPTWQILVIFFLLGYGLGNTIAPSTAMMTMSIPVERSGAGSAVQNTIRQVGAALGTAIIATLVATIYSRNMNSGLVNSGINLTPEMLEGSTESVGGAFGVAEMAAANSLLPAGTIDQLQTIAIESFMTSYQIACITGAVVVVVALIVVALKMPDKTENVAWGKPKA